MFFHYNPIYLTIRVGIISTLTALQPVRPCDQALRHAEPHLHRSFHRGDDPQTHGLQSEGKPSAVSLSDVCLLPLQSKRCSNALF